MNSKEETVTIPLDKWEHLMSLLKSANALAKDYEYAKREVIHWNREAVRLREAVESFRERAATFSRPNLVGSNPQKSATAACTWIAGDADRLLADINAVPHENDLSREDRDALGRMVRDVERQHAQEPPEEIQRCIGETLYEMGRNREQLAQHAERQRWQAIEKVARTDPDENGSQGEGHHE